MSSNKVINIPKSWKYEYGWPLELKAIIFFENSFGIVIKSIFQKFANNFLNQLSITCHPDRVIDDWMNQEIIRTELYFKIPIFQEKKIYSDNVARFNHTRAKSYEQRAKSYEQRANITNNGDNLEQGPRVNISKI